MLWKKMGKKIERLGRLVKLLAKHLPLGLNMIKFGHDGPSLESMLKRV
jgi:hypothetical protein